MIFGNQGTFKGIIINNDFIHSDGFQKQDRGWSTCIETMQSYNKIKQVIWMSAVHRNEEGKPIEIGEQLVDVVDLLHKCRELVMLLEMHKNGKIKYISEKKILKRFDNIETANVRDSMIDTIWTKKHLEEDSVNVPRNRRRKAQQK